MKKYFIAQEVFFSTQKASLSFKRKKKRKRKAEEFSNNLKIKF